jgi:dephospho-CoA kinase
MLRVGLTGGVACGKSSVARQFEQRGARVLRADDVARELMEPGTPVYKEVVERFGRSVLRHDGRIDRKSLADAVFNSALSRIAELNAIVHPAVIAKQDAWMAEQARREPHSVAIIEAALILEAGARSHFDKLITVTCRPEQKIERFARRQAISLDEARAEVTRRSAAQWPDEEKVRAADCVIDNSGSEADAERQVENIWQELQKSAADGRR